MQELHLHYQTLFVPLYTHNETFHMFFAPCSTCPNSRRSRLDAESLKCCTSCDTCGGCGESMAAQVRQFKWRLTLVIVGIKSIYSRFLDCQQRGYNSYGLHHRHGVGMLTKTCRVPIFPSKPFRRPSRIQAAMHTIRGYWERQGWLLVRLLSRQHHIRFCEPFFRL